MQENTSDRKQFISRFDNPLKIENAQQKLENAYEAMMTNAKPIKAAFAEIKKEYDKELDKLNKVFLVEFDEYLDTLLLDKNGSPIKIHNVIQKDDKKYKVIDRGMQFVFGSFMYNTRIVVKKIQPDNTIKPTGKGIELSTLDLMNFELIPEEHENS